MDKQYLIWMSQSPAPSARRMRAWHPHRGAMPTFPRDMKLGLSYKVLFVSVPAMAFSEYKSKRNILFMQTNMHNNVIWVVEFL